MEKEIKVYYNDINYIIKFKESKPKKTTILDLNGKKYFRIARKLLRIKTKELNLSNDGYLYNKAGNEYITHEYFRKVYNFINK